jgi:hypothetical protein
MEEVQQMHIACSLGVLVFGDDVQTHAQRMAAARPHTTASSTACINRAWINSVWINTA